MRQALRELLGKAVRDEWVRCAQELNDPKPSHLVPWEALNDTDKEIDRRIGEAVIAAFCDRPLYTERRNEAVRTIHELITSYLISGKQELPPEAFFHLGEFLALTGGHEEA